jgi:hypothetical protein
MDFHALSRLCAVATLSLGISLPAAQEAALYRVSCGGDGFVDPSGHFWEPDSHYEGGQTFSADSAILNTDVPQLYQRERWLDPDIGGLKYVFPVRAGDYKVILHFAEIWDGAFAAGQRVFDVQINGTTVAADLDVFAQVGADTPLIMDFLTTAVDGNIAVEFLNKVGNAKIAGIEVLPTNPPRATTAPYRIHCGGEDYIDPQGNWWEGDGHYSSGGIYFVSSPVSNTDMSLLYQTERWSDPGQGDLSYSFDVAEGGYTVRLHFAEIYFQDPGMRVFDVDINGKNVITGLDLAADPGPYSAAVKEFVAPSQDGKIVVSFRNGTEHAKISGIEILPSAPVRNRFAAKPVTAPGAQAKARAGAIALDWPGAKRYAAVVKDFRGRQVVSLQGAGPKSITGLRAGLYVVRMRSGGATRDFRVPLF